MDLKTISEQPEGFCPPDLTVRIVKVWERKSGNNENGDWSFQNVDVEQGGTKATLKLKNLPVFPDTRVGQTVTIRAFKSDKHGLSGIKTDSREYQGKTYKSIVITPSGKWDWGESEQTTGQTTGVDSNGNGHAVSNPSSYAEHLLAVADLTVKVSMGIGISEDSAMQACFATICIDTKNRGLLLPKPMQEEVNKEQQAQEPDLDPIPF